MRILFNYNALLGFEDDWGDVKFGIGWFKHHPGHKWRGFDIIFYLYWYRVNFTFVNNWKEYDKKINYWRQPEYIKKREEKMARWKAMQAEKDKK